MRHFVIRGAKGVGKTTLVNRLLSEIPARAGGFFTCKSQPDCNGIARVAIFPATLPREMRHITDENIVGVCNPQCMLSANAEVFDILGTAYLQKTENCNILVMDELGFMENRAQSFQSAVLKVLDGNIPILACVKDKDTPFLSRVCNHPYVQLWQLTEQNREEVFNEILPMLQSYFRNTL